MKKYLFILGLFLSLSASAQISQPEIIKLADLERIIRSQNDTTYIINFWATWCVPCVKEFPAFQALAKAHKNEKVKVVMMSLDFKKGYQQTLVPFVNKHPIDGVVYLLDEPDYNSWINKVSPEWQGEIPVTLMVNSSKKLYAFFNRDFTAKTLEETFTKTIKK